ncbi:MAG: hypothetical protein D6769_01465 [Methanobacteriota archaeon]|nr:MAG: hypothetical protein D6769_01465 [Euryarchaeota archaeon]
MALDLLMRVFITGTYLAIGTTLDVLNNKDIPNNIMLLFIISSLLFSYVLLPWGQFTFALLQAVLILALGYIAYKFGIMGLADPVFFSIIALMFPIVPSSLVGVPFILPVLLYSGVLFGLFSAIYFSIAVARKGISKLEWKNALILPAFLVFWYFYSSSSMLYNPLFAALLFILSLSASLVGIFAPDIKKAITSTLPVDEAEEEVIAEDLPTNIKAVVGNSKVVDRKLIEKLKKKGIREIPVYAGMLPYLPFLAAGFLLSLFYANLILFF